ncbi:hypothetical protein EMCRGX_G031222 [Ephydatia muelleri]
MADSRLVLPQPFDFRKPDEWPRWLRRFEQYRVASGLSTEDEGKQVNTLLYCLDEEAGEVFAACDATDKAKKAASAYTFFALSVALSLHLVPAIEPCALENKILSHSEKLLERMDCFRVHLLRLVDGITRCEYLSCLLTQAIQQCVNLLPFVLCRKTRCHPVLLKASQVFGNRTLYKPTILSLYDPGAETKLSSDASSYGLGAVLLQLHQDGWKPVVYASRSLTGTERCYAQIEKEALAITWACEKFSEYILGKQILIEMDHKPLVPLLRVPVDSCIEFQKEVESHIAAVTETLPATKQQLDKYHHAQAADTKTGAMISYCKFGWPVKAKLPRNLKPYWMVRAKLTLHHDLLLYGSRIVIPQGLRQETMLKIHQGHQGILKCRLCVESAVWWPGVSDMASLNNS